MAIWIEAISLDSLNQRGQNTMMSYLAIKFTDIGDDFLRAQMPVDARTKQPLGIMHGGASCVLAESVGSAAANYCVNQKTHYCVGLSINTSHLRAIREEHVIATAKPYHLGRSTQVWHIDIHNAQQIDIHNAQQKLISVTRLTMAVLQRE